MLPHAPATTGIGLRAPHIERFAALRPRLPFIEVHAENHLCGGPMRLALRELRRDYDISLHCVGLSIGTAGPLDEAHLDRIARLADEIDPIFVSDHLSAALVGGLYSGDLIPVPYTQEALGLAITHVDRIQEVLGRTIMVENPSRYVAYRESSIHEGAFLGELARATGCGLLCDVNNIFVSARNLGGDPAAELARFPATAVQEIHLAGHESSDEDGEVLLIDTHDRQVCNEVVALYGEARLRFAGALALLEWDANLPELEVLLAEAARIEKIAQARIPAHALA